MDSHIAVNLTMSIPIKCRLPVNRSKSKKHSSMDLDIFSFCISSGCYGKNEMPKKMEIIFLC
ncbi:MAG: hypothetical protein C4522_03325 [Desulfobacteraceae bacterium]|nr:MAG: hypothetical protein C4522_03325 [Desulfobacteraceae bacterium]